MLRIMRRLTDQIAFENFSLHLMCSLTFNEIFLNLYKFDTTSVESLLSEISLASATFCM